jgi:cysteine desulfurase
MHEMYLDYNGTSPVLPEIAQEALRVMTECFGNPSSQHSWGVAAKKVLTQSRQQVAKFLGCREQEVIFTSSATESINMVFKGLNKIYPPSGRRNKIITSQVEHKAVLRNGALLEEAGYRVEYIGVDSRGQLDLSALRQAIDDDTLLVSIMAANNETGNIFPIAEIGAMTRARDVFFHVDATCAVQKIPLDVRKMQIDFLSFSGHKIYAPKGVGVLYRRAGLKLASLLDGATQEFSSRSGTENMPAIAGLRLACELAMADMPVEMARQRQLRDQLLAGLRQQLPDCVVCGDPLNGLANTLFIAFPGVESAILVMKLSEAGIAVSNGSACNSGSFEPSYVLRAMHLPGPVMAGAIRFSLGRLTSAADIATVLQRLPAVVAALRQE